MIKEGSIRCCARVGCLNLFSTEWKAAHKIYCSAKCRSADSLRKWKLANPERAKEIANKYNRSEKGRLNNKVWRQNNK